MPKLLRVTTVPMSLRYLIRGQAKYMQSQGIEVHLASADGAEIEDVISYEGVPHHVFPLTRKVTPLTDLRCIIRMARFIRDEQIDLVHSHTPKAGLIAMIAAFLGGAKGRLHTIAGIPWMESKGVARFVLKLADRLALAFATKVYSNSFQLKAFILSEKLTDASKLKVLGNGSSNGIDTTFFSSEAVIEDKTELRKQYKIPTDAFVFVFVGRIVKDKGINELLKAMQAMSADVHLLLVGPLEQALDPISEHSLHVLANDARIHHVGYQNDVRPFLKMSDALVFPSYREGFPNVPMQAGAMGLPSIVSRINGCSEIIEEGLNGLYCEAKSIDGLKNTMEQMRNEKDAYLRMQGKARAMIVERFGQEMIWSALYREYTEQLAAT